MKLKVDHYRGRGKKRTYDILMFPDVKNAWTYDDYPEESGPRVDGDRELFRLLKVALALLTSDTSKILYFPIKHEGYHAIYQTTYHLVLLRPELQFRRSEWFELKGKLNKRHWVGKHVIRYNEQKLLDYYEKKLKGRLWLEQEQEKYYVEEILGDAVFMVLLKENCYRYHQMIANSDIVTGEQRDGLNEPSNYVGIGWVLSDKVISEMRKDRPSPA